jgi:hypothetical protein
MIFCFLNVKIDNYKFLLLIDKNDGELPLSDIMVTRNPSRTRSRGIFIEFKIDRLTTDTLCYVNHE